MPNRKLTIDDVAAASGVARVTVSRVINKDPKVRAATRERVEKAIAELGYSANPRAQALASSDRRLILMLHAGSASREPNSYYDSGLELGALRECTAMGYDLASRTVDPDSPALVERIAQVVAAEQPSGVVLPPPLCDDPKVIELLAKLSVSVAAISAAPENLAVPSVGIDDAEGGRAIAAHLAGLGHRRIAFLSGPANHRSAATRLDGFRDELARLGLSPAWVGEGDFTFVSGIEQAQALLDARVGATALACANDDMAAGAMLTFHRRGIELPGAMSVTGFDDTPVSRIVWPPLTTVRQPIPHYGERAVRLAVRGRTDEPGPSREIVDFELVTRESTGPVAGMQRR